MKREHFLWVSACVGLMALCATVTQASINDVRIAEAYADPAGADLIEFVEFTGPSATALAGLTLVVIEGDGSNRGNIINVENLAGVLPADGLWVLGTAATPNPGVGNPPDQLTGSALQNGSQTYLLVTGFTGALGNDVDTDNNGVIDGSYTQLGTIIDSVAVVDNNADSTYAGAPRLGPVGPIISPGSPAGVARRVNGVDTDSAADWTVTSADLIPPNTGTGVDGFPAASPGIVNAYTQNIAPIAQDGEADVLAESVTGVVVQLSATDDGIPGPLTYTIVDAPTKGELTDPNNGDAPVGAGEMLASNQVRYTPLAGQTGADSFTFKANDGALDSNTATIDITIVVNQAPVAADGNLTVAKNASPGAIATLTATDDSLPNPTLVYRIIAVPAHGTLTDPDNVDAPVVAGGLLVANHVRYTPAADYAGPDSFTFVANDGALDSNTATVSVLVSEDTVGVIITEIMYNPAGSEPAWEWVELLNLGNAPVALKTLNDANNNTAANLTGLTIGAQEAVIVTRSKTTNPTSAEFLAAWSPLVADQVFQTATTGAWPSLNNGDETLTLIDANDQILDTVAYQSGSGWPTSTNGVSIYLLSNHLSAADNDTGANWSLSVSGTDGAYTSVGATPDIGSPGIVAGFPPIGGQPPVLTAAVSEKTHGVAGTFSINVLAAAGTENRSGGPTKIVATFDIPIQITSGNASVTLSSGTVSSLVVAGNQLTINMSGATAHQPLTIGFGGVADAADAGALSTSTLCLGVQFGDANNDRNTNLFDLVVMRNVVNTAATGTSFRMDPTADGNINVFDLVQVRNVLNTFVPACP